MASPVSTLLGTSLRGWFSAKGFLLVAAAALLPVVLVGAWVLTHQGDVAAVGVTWTPEDPEEGDAVNVTATFRNTGNVAVNGFNATVHVGQVFGNQFRSLASETENVKRLGPGESVRVSVTWTAQAGIRWILADADPEDEVPEVEEFNNQKAVPFAIRFREVAAPLVPGNLTGSGGASVDVEVADLAWDDPVSGENATFTARFRNTGPGAADNVTLHLRLGRVFSGTLFPEREESDTVALGAGETATLNFTWLAREGAYWVQAYANVTGAGDSNGENNYRAESVLVDPRVTDELTPPEPPEKLTIKDFYLQVLSLLHLRILVPLIGLFYAAGVIADEKARGTLPYLLTRPLPRWLIPLTTFAASFVVAAAALSVGIVAAFLLLFQTPQGNVGFLTTPLLASLLGLFVYGSFFALLGTWVDRPYLIGLAFVLGWETIAGNFVPWVTKLTLTHHLLRAVSGSPSDFEDGWHVDAGLEWLPEGEPALRALRLVLGLGVAFLVAAAVSMKRREFDV